MTNREKQALLQVVTAIMVAAFLLSMVARINLSAVKESQKVERAEKYLGFAEFTVRLRLSQALPPYEPTAEGTLPPEVTTDFAKAQGGAPYFHEEGRYARLDMFGGERPFSIPLMYVRTPNLWVIASRGPDGDRDIPSVPEQFDAGDQLVLIQYDPTNGTLSNGDLIRWGTWQE